MSKAYSILFSIFQVFLKVLYLQQETYLVYGLSVWTINNENNFESLIYLNQNVVKYYSIY